MDIDSVFNAALNAGGDLTMVGKPRISAEGIRANGNILLELDNGTPTLNVFSPDPSTVTALGDTSGVSVTEAPPLDLDAVRLKSSEWEELASNAPSGYYFDTDGVFNSKDTEVTLNNFDCDSIPADGEGQRTIFVDGDVNFTGTLSGVCTVISTGKIIGTGNFYTGAAGAGTTVSMVAMDDVLLNFDTEAQSFLNGLVYTEGDYELHGKIKFTGVVTALGNVAIQNPSEFTNNHDANFWYTYSSAYNLIADPIDVLSWHEKPRGS